ncbi:MAG: hypothetical protein ACTSWN_12080 [Promethearchaeota archaeon]
MSAEARHLDVNVNNRLKPLLDEFNFPNFLPSNEIHRAKNDDG